MKTEYLFIPESLVCVALCLVALLVIAAGLIGYFKGKEDRKQISTQLTQPKGKL